MLADLDELILRCRDERARSYIAEAVGCYRASAFRSAIVATWVAVCYDIIDKLRDLALAGDRGAEEIIEKVDAARRANDFAKTLRLERELIDVARDRFELISHLEHIDLARLREDRNRCAHPSLNSDEAMFSASAELARVHIRAAVTYLLEHPPAQGKFALERLTREVSSEYFPISAEGAHASLSLGPLRRPRASLVRNFIVVLFKLALDEHSDYKVRLRIVSALVATRRLHPEMFTMALREKVNLIFREATDADLMRVTSVLLDVGDLWEQIAGDVRNRIENFVCSLPDLRYLNELLDFSPLAKQARERLRLATIEELDQEFYFTLHEFVGDKYIESYLASKNYEQANERAKRLAVYAPDMSEFQQRRIVAGIDSNGQLRGSFEAGGLISALRRTNKIENATFDALLRACGLEKFVPAAPKG